MMTFQQERLDKLENSPRVSIVGQFVQQSPVPHLDKALQDIQGNHSNDIFIIKHFTDSMDDNRASVQTWKSKNHIACLLGVCFCWGCSTTFLFMIDSKSLKMTFEMDSVIL